MRGTKRGIRLNKNACGVHPLLRWKSTSAAQGLTELMETAACGRYRDLCEQIKRRFEADKLIPAL